MARRQLITVSKKGSYGYYTVFETRNIKECLEYLNIPKESLRLYLLGKVKPKKLKDYKVEIVKFSALSEKTILISKLYEKATSELKASRDVKKRLTCFKIEVLQSVFDFLENPENSTTQFSDFKLFSVFTKELIENADATQPI